MGAGEAPMRAAQTHEGLGGPLELPDGRGRGGDARGVQELAPVGEVAAADGLGAPERVDRHREREQGSEGDVPVHQVEPGDIQVAAARPDPAGHERGRDDRAGARSCPGLLVPQPRRDQWPPDAAPLPIRPPGPAQGRPRRGGRTPTRRRRPRSPATGRRSRTAARPAARGSSRWRAASRGEDRTRSYEGLNGVSKAAAMGHRTSAWAVRPQRDVAVHAE